MLLFLVLIDILRTTKAQQCPNYFCELNPLACQERLVSHHLEAQASNTLFGTARSLRDMMLRSSLQAHLISMYYPSFFFPPSLLVQSNVQQASVAEFLEGPGHSVTERFTLLSV
jgi:hypothetical protein